MPRKANPAKLAASAKRLELQELEWLIESLNAEVAERQAKAARPESELEGWTPEFRKFGKTSCWCATAEQGHGPYYYRSVRQGEKVTKVYRRKSEV
ncbi:MAG: hypothetical protein HC824_14215 [Synechococcales cyanobacterium RM1_1_8]|nr:hypothetical protein [Synechococcales cyanobacterium RM1_1_8]